MKSGIHLGRPPTRTAPSSIDSAPRRRGRGPRARGSVSADPIGSRCALEPGARLGAVALGASAPAPGETPLVATRLRLALDSGVTEALPPTELLRLVESALPEGVLLGRLSFNATPQPILTLEATTLSGDRVTEMERRLLSSPAVATTSLLEERRLADGTAGRQDSSGARAEMKLFFLVLGFLLAGRDALLGPPSSRERESRADS